MWWQKRLNLDQAAGVAGNPSSPHEEGRQAKAVLEDARTTIARLVEAQADDVIFTSGATEANALAILGLARPGAHLLYLPSAHASIVENMKMAEERGAVVEALPIKDGAVDTEALARLLRPETVLISMDAVCGETGVIWNTREVAATLRGTRSGESNFSLARGRAATREEITFPAALLHVDASQAPLTEKITRAHFGADLLTFDGAKVGALRGIGVLIAHRTIPLAPLYRGGGQERGLRPGSETPELARAFAEALSAAARSHEVFYTTAKQERERLVERVTRDIPDVYINKGHRQTPNILSLSLPGRDTDYLVALLDEAGIAVSSRSACETDSEEGSRAVFILTGDKERAHTTLRVSWGPSTRAGDLTRFAGELVRAVAFVDSGARG